jgi:hypothetical protein
MFAMIAGVAAYAINVLNLKDVLDKINVCGFQAIFLIMAITCHMCILATETQTKLKNK